jgi:hypothetical protein
MGPGMLSRSGPPRGGRAISASSSSGSGAMVLEDEHPRTAEVIRTQSRCRHSTSLSMGWDVSIPLRSPPCPPRKAGRRPYPLAGTRSPGVPGIASLRHPPSSSELQGNTQCLKDSEDTRTTLRVWWLAQSASGLRGIVTVRNHRASMDPRSSLA